ncbi:MAG: hypothetical protein J6Q05_03905 [Elusimicrobiaceae bacterium]|nr:hypothetical protein [Elusimicrobiaceae bacterium]
MIKILIKALILICIILSIYFIVNPSACSNLMSGKVVNSMEKVPTFVPKDQDHSELLTPAGDQPVKADEKPTKTTPVEQQPAPETVTTEEPAQTDESSAPAVTDTNSVQEAQQVAQEVAKEAYTQEQADYALAARYVELENEYISKKKDTKNAAKEISYIVMDDFELTPSEWEAFLQRATAENLFEKVRAEQAAKK